MRILFCCDPLQLREPDEAYQREVNAAERAGLMYSLIDFDAFTREDNVARAVRRVGPLSAPELTIYRGWMLRPEVYGRLEKALRQRNVILLNDEQAYRHCHYLPESYTAIRAYTPSTVWLHSGRDVDMNVIMEILRPFGSKPVIVKDFVKSRKHEWFDACYISAANERGEVERVVNNFVARQDEASWHEGLVFREFVQLEPLAKHSKSGMPLSREYRRFYLDGRLIAEAPYWDEGVYGNMRPPEELFQEVVRNVKSRFFTMDIARRKNGDWLIVELGDGQVAELPQSVDIDAFYHELAGA
ncbi:ATP-grasp domain-containing protein [Ktedonospora formicarum]|uniref:ATP-grasp domain-containing protein n=1 Tax=Ktedonospora formicarum TaxID=2778364 RepID=A0A8J3MRW6_9CHLR|nr:ATP-grasp domain-containing protein [Ktedonospora formicarum]GHO44008.1 hypothetical protein KSX_21710 [Ktedonospora formicarum]